MLSVYLNYPTSHVSVHRDPACRSIRMNRKPGQRVRQINIANVSVELRGFRDKQHQFGSTPQCNDMWLEMDFGDQDFEEAVTRYVKRLLGRHYQSFADSSVRIHC